MFQLLLACAALCFMTAASAGIAVRAPDERVEDFVLRYAPPGSTIAHKVIETTQWSPYGKIIVAFFEHP